MALRPRLASLAAGLVVLASLGLSGASPVRAGDDPICATKPEQCVSLTLRVTGYLAGTALADANVTTHVLSCHHDPGGTTTTCTGRFGVVGASRTVSVVGNPDNPAGAWVCVGTGTVNNCGTNGQGVDVTLESGGRTKTANISFNPIDGKTVTVSRGGTGTGTVTSDKGGISCGSACTWMYAPSVTVVLTASPSGGSTFAGWSGGTCQGQDATCQLVTNADVTTQAIFNAPTPPPPSVGASASPAPSKTPAPTPTATAATATKSPGPSAGHSSGPTGPSFKPPTFAPGVSPPGTTQDPGSTQDDIPSFDPSTADANTGPTPTPFKFATDDPNRTDIPLNELPPLGSQPTGPAGTSGSGPPWVVIGLIVLLGVLVGGGAFWWARRRNAAL